MATKQEKLAAARKKLKEFQGKQREPENSKLNVPDFGTPIQLQQNLLHLSAESSPSQTPTLGEQNNSVVITQNESDNVWRNPSLGSHFEETVPSSETHKTPQHSATSWFDINQHFINTNRAFTGGPMPPSDVNSQNNLHPDDFNIQSSHPSNSVETNSNDIFKSSLNHDKNSYQLNNNENINNKPFQDNYKNKSGSITPEIDFSKKTQSYPNNIFPTRENSSACQLDNPEYSTQNMSGSRDLDNVIQHLQTELQNHAQTINILVQQRNEAQNALVQAQTALNDKSDEISKQKQQIMLLTQTINDLNKKLTESESLAMNLNLENDNKVQQINKINMEINELKSQFNFKEEECLELRRKYEEKCKECHHILYSLNETQSQLSLCQIKIQNEIQPSEDKSEIIERLATLESEKVQLSQQLEGLRKELEAANLENEHSSQNFKVYVQQCKAEVETLNSQLKELTAANEKLKQRNEAIEKSSLEVEAQKDDVSGEEYKNEIAKLNDEIYELTGIKTEMERKHHKLEEEISNLKKDLMEKDVRLYGMAEAMKDLESENKKLLLDVNLPKSGEANLLAAMESDKVAAAKAVSQNQKLKSQVMELEEAFVKISEEKLQLTDQLSHEKHLNKELQNRLNDLESRDKDESQHKHQCSDEHDHHHSEHDHVHSREEQLVNDSHEIDELKRIIRQLQDDKMELKSRLSLSMTTEMTPSERKELRRISASSELSPTERRELRRLSVESESEELKHEDAKLRLQQMEEKVRKTMNEIAILDEEKEKLEHLVLQLQGETETIGEYIALYQKQRMLLKQRAQEKDVQLIQLSKDKEELKSKLNDLDELVQHLLKERNGVGEAADETVKSQVNENHQEETENTAVKIRALISEIGSTNLINNETVAFKHCSCCSGRLITI